jgi:hypothetical protein
VFCHGGKLLMDGILWGGFGNGKEYSNMQWPLGCQCFFFLNPDTATKIFASSLGEKWLWRFCYMTSCFFFCFVLSKTWPHTN